MPSSVELLESLLGERTVDLVTSKTIDLNGMLPMATVASFTFDFLDILGESSIVAKPVRNMSPEETIKQAHVIARATGLQIILRFESVSPYLRQKLIAAEIGFLTDAGEFFMPAKIRLRANNKPRAHTARTSLSPTTKAVALTILLNPGRKLTSADIANLLGISPTAAKRALQALAEEMPITRSVAGPTRRTYFYKIDDSDAFAEAASESFGPAVRERFLVTEKDAAGLPLCGLSALAERSLLSPPRIPQVAAAPSRASELRKAAVSKESEGTIVEVNVLDYDPSPFVENGIVDAFTMRKTIRSADERIEMALEEASEETPWLRFI